MDTNLRPLKGYKTISRYATCTVAEDLQLISGQKETVGDITESDGIDDATES